MKFLDFNNVLCLSPHPDDIEFAIGGTILKYGDTKFTSVVFSTGSVYDPVSNEARWEECRQYWKDTPNIEQHFLSPLLKMYSEEEWINLIEKRFDVKTYDAIFFPPLLDTHYEHRLVNGIAFAISRVVAASLIEYKSVSVMDSWVPNLIVDIKDVAEDKIKRLERFESQKKLYFKSDYMRHYHTHMGALKRSVEVVEQFRIVNLYV